MNIYWFILTFHEIYRWICYWLALNNHLKQIFIFVALIFNKPSNQYTLIYNFIAWILTHPASSTLVPSLSSTTAERRKQEARPSCNLSGTITEWNWPISRSSVLAGWPLGFKNSKWTTPIKNNLRLMNSNKPARACRMNKKKASSMSKNWSRESLSRTSRTKKFNTTSTRSVRHQTIPNCKRRCSA